MTQLTPINVEHDPLVTSAGVPLEVTNGVFTSLSFPHIPQELVETSPILTGRIKALQIEGDMLERIHALLKSGNLNKAFPNVANNFWSEIVTKHVSEAWKDLHSLEEQVIGSFYSIFNASAWDKLDERLQSLVHKVADHHKELKEMLRGIQPNEAVQALLSEFLALTQCAIKIYQQSKLNPVCIKPQYFSQIMPGDVLVQDGASSLVLGTNHDCRYPFMAPLVSITRDGHINRHNVNLSSLIASGRVNYLERSGRPVLLCGIQTLCREGEVLCKNLERGDLVEFANHDSSLRCIEILDIKNFGESLEIVYLDINNKSGEVSLRQQTESPHDKFFVGDDGNINPPNIRATRRLLSPLDSQSPNLQTMAISLIASIYRLPDTLENESIVFQELHKSTYNGDLLKIPRVITTTSPKLKLDIALGWNGAQEFYNHPYLVAREWCHCYCEARSGKNVTTHSKGSVLYSPTTNEAIKNLLSASVLEKLDLISQEVVSLPSNEVIIPTNGFHGVTIGDKIYHSDGCVEEVVRIKSTDPTTWYIETRLQVKSGVVCELKNHRNTLPFFPEDQPIVVRNVPNLSPSLEEDQDKRHQLIPWHLLPDEDKALLHANLRAIHRLIGLLDNTVNHYLMGYSDYLAQNRPFLKMLRNGLKHHTSNSANARIPDYRFEELTRSKERYHSTVINFRRHFEELCLYAERIPGDLEVHYNDPSIGVNQVDNLSLSATLKEVNTMIEEHIKCLRLELKDVPDKGMVREKAYSLTLEWLMKIRESCLELIYLVESNKYVVKEMQRCFPIPASTISLLPGHTQLELNPNTQLFEELSQLTQLFHKPNSIAEQGVIISPHPPQKFQDYHNKGAQFFTYRKDGRILGYLIAFPPDKVRNIAPEVETRYGAWGKFCWYLHLVVSHPQARGAHRFLHNAWRLLALKTGDAAVARVHIENERSWKAHLLSQGWNIVTPDTTLFYPAEDPQHGALFVGMYLDLHEGVLGVDTNRANLLADIIGRRLKGVIG